VGVKKPLIYMVVRWVLYRR